MTTRKILRITAAIGALIVTGMVLGLITAHYYTGSSDDTPPDPRMLWPDPKSIQDFSISDHTGSEFGLEQLKGQWTFLFFGYTNCPDICPVTMSVLNQVDTVLDGRGIEDTQTVFVSVDPRRDTQARVAEYVKGFNPGFIGLRGSAAEVRALTEQLGVLSRSHAHEGSGPEYLVDHSTAVFLTDPQGRLIGLFTPPYSVDQIVARYIQIRSFINDRS